MTENSLEDAFKDELRDAYDAERQLLKALPKMAKAASAPQLKKAFESHLEETRGQVALIERVFASLDEKVRGKHCDGIEGIIEEGESVMEEDFDAATMDACLIAAGQRAEHYEMAAYGTLVAWAQTLGHDQAAGMLERILDQEKAADRKLTELAEGGINRSAAVNGKGENGKGENGKSMNGKSEGRKDDRPKARRKPVTRTRMAAKTAARGPSTRKR